MTPKHRGDLPRVEPETVPGIGPSPATPASPSGPPGGGWSIPSAVTAVSAASAKARPGRLRRSLSPLVRLKGRRTILDTPEEEAERKPPIETVLAGWTGAIISHTVLVLLLLLLVFLLPKEKERLAFDTELGSAFGDEDGLDLIGGFDDALELASEVEEDSRIFEPMPIEDLATGIDLSSDLAQTDPNRSEVGGSTGIGGGEFGSARFGEGLETIRGIDVKVGDPQFTLIWDTKADIDLHVVEPGGSRIYWANRRGNRGGELDVDDTDGFGPENIYWLDPDSLDGENVKGQGPEGVYHWYVHYYAAPRGFGGRSVPTRWKVRVKHAGEVTVFEGVLRRVNERSTVRSLRVGASSGIAASAPDPSDDLDARPDFDFEDDDDS